MKRLFKIILPLLSKGRLLKYIVLGILSGLMSFLFINCVTRVIGLIIAGRSTTISKEYIIVFSSIIILFIWIRRTLSLAIINLSQTLFWRLRKEIIASVLKSNYEQLSVRKVNIHSAILNDVYALTDASVGIIGFSTSLILGIACLVYLATLSLVLFLITLGIALLGIAVYHFTTKKNMQEFQKARGLESKFLENFNAILDGFKEIYMEPKKGRSIYDLKITTIANESYSNNKTAFTGFLNNQITGQVLFYILISSVLVFFSLTLGIKANDTVSFVFTLLYLLGSIETIMVLLPGFMRARVAANHLMDLKKELEDADLSDPLPATYITKDEFEQITVNSLEFHYGENDKSFGIGPVNFDIQKGDTIFIYGGNGSGKTTFIHCILGLYLPASGEIKLNGILVDKKNYSSYRTIFSVVFSDFYLFNELLWIERLDMDKWDGYLRLFELEGKVSIKDGVFSTTELSTGQRKRLALIATLLEEKSVLVMDEWAADQDPNFRKKFYLEIIPLLKRKGFTIIAITHDDKYYHCADKLYKMDYGKLIEERVNVYESAVIDLPV